MLLALSAVPLQAAQRHPLLQLPRGRYAGGAREVRGRCAGGAGRTAPAGPDGRPGEAGGVRDGGKRGSGGSEG